MIEKNGEVIYCKTFVKNQSPDWKTKKKKFGTWKDVSALSYVKQIMYWHPLSKILILIRKYKYINYTNI